MRTRRQSKTIRIPNDVAERISSIASREERTFSQQIVKMLRDQFAADDQIHSGGTQIDMDALRSHELLERLR